MNELQNSLNQAQWVLGCMMGVAMLILVLAVKASKALGRSLRDEYREAGGHKQLAKNVATKGAAAVLKKIIKGRFH
jgi:hypothetical protein